MSAETRANILRTAARLGFPIEGGAPGARQRLVGLFAPPYGAALGWSSGAVHEVEEPVRELVERRSYGLVLGSFGDPDRPSVGDRLLADGEIAGVILLRTRDEARLVAPLRARGIPYVIVYRHLPGTDLNWVGVDHARAMRVALGHLDERGFGGRALLCGPTSYPSMAAYREAFAAHEGAGRGSAPVAEVELDEEAGYRGAAALLARGSVRALVCCSDRLAFGALKAAREAKRRVGRDLAVISIDGTRPTGFSDPPLTVVRIPWRQLYGLAASLLLEAIALAPRLQTVQAVLDVELVPRASTGA